jgi:hypothetical protein
MRLGLLAQFALGIAGAVALTAVAVAVWYGFSYAVLLVMGRILPLRGWKSKDENGPTVSARQPSGEPSPTRPPKG